MEMHCKENVLSYTGYSIVGQQQGCFFRPSSQFTIRCMHHSVSYAFSVYPSSHVTTVAQECNGNGGLKLAFNQNSFCSKGSFLYFCHLVFFYSSRLKLRDSLQSQCYDYLSFFHITCQALYRETDSRDKKLVTPVNLIQIPNLGYDFNQHCLKSTHLCASLSFCG